MAKLVEFVYPDSPNATVCRSCGACVQWIVTESGKRMPLSYATKRVREDGVTVAQSHFADCPNANTHRKASR